VSPIQFVIEWICQHVRWIPYVVGRLRALEPRGVVVVVHRIDGLERVRRWIPPLLDIEKSRLPPHLRPPASTRPIESRTRQNHYGFWRSPADCNP
jgi:hypothetical protein